MNERQVQAAAFPAALLWCELVFKASTTHGWWPALAYLVLFSLAAGGVLWLVAQLPRTRTGRVRISIGLLAALALAYLVEYFVFRQFKVFYDLGTVVAGAGGVATGFLGTAFALVLSPSGLAHVAAFAAPAVAYGWLMHELAGEEAAEAEPSAPVHGAHFAGPEQGAPPPARAGAHFAAANAPEPSAPARARATLASHPALAVLAAVVVLHGVALGTIHASGPWGAAYAERYAFEDCVTNFGLATGLRREVQRLLTGEANSVSFSAAQPQVDSEALAEDEAARAAAEEALAAAEAEAAAQAALDALPDRERYGVSALDIDFSALAETTQGTWAELDRYVAAQVPSSKNAMTGAFFGKNLIFISAEAFSAEAIREDITPTLWRMATRGVQFLDFYQFDAAGTTGGECANLFGLLAVDGGNSVRETAGHNNYLTIGNALNRLGYAGWAFHNNTYTYYGRDSTHVNLGYSHGYMGYGNGMEQWVEWQWPQSDLEMIRGTFDELYGSDRPFNVYYMSVSGHSDYSRAGNAMAEKNWDVVADLPYSEPVRAYLGANVELDRAMEWLLGRLEEEGIARDTVIVISADHFPYGLDDDGPLGRMPYTAELYGMESVDTYFQRDHNRAILWCGALEDEEPLVVTSPTMSIDLLPTLLNLFGCEWDSRLLPGRDVFSDREALAFDFSYDWKTERGTYYAGAGRFEPAGEPADDDADYVARINATVADKMTYCRGVLKSDYYAHVFGESEDVAEVNARGRAAHPELFAGPVDMRQVAQTIADALRA